MSAALKILVIRRDNIGDLVCTTPVFTALRRRYPTAQICALVNSYNAPALAQHPDVDRVFVYTKLKHRAPGESRLRLLWERLRMGWELKKIGFDFVLLPSDKPRLIRFALGLRPKHVVALGQSAAPSKIVTMLPSIKEGAEHEVQATYRLLAPLDVHGTPPATSIVSDTIETSKAHAAIEATLGSGPVVGIHISARKPSQRWANDRFVELMRTLHTRYGLRFVLLWAPGPKANPLHPGDDDSAYAILQAAHDLPVLPFATHTLSALVGALSICDAVICSDGGAMHLAAALDKPIVCLFGKSNAWRWHPWGVPYELLQAASQEANDIKLNDVLNAVCRLLRLKTAS